MFNSYVTNYQRVIFQFFCNGNDHSQQKMTFVCALSKIDEMIPIVCFMVKIGFRFVFGFTRSRGIIEKMFNSQIEVGSCSEKLVKLSEWLGYIVIVICINYSD